MKSTTYIYRLIKWIFEGKFIFIFLLLFLIPFLVIRNSSDVNRLRLYGLFLQILGVVPLAISLREKSLLFGKSTFFKSLKNYIKRFPLKYNPKNIDVSTNENMIFIESFDVRARVSPEENFQAIIKYIDHELQVINDRIDKDTKEINEKIQKLVEANDSIKATVNQGLNTLETKMVQVNVSDVSRDYFGIFTLIYGLILATIPELIIAFF